MKVVCLPHSSWVWEVCRWQWGEKKSCYTVCFICSPSVSSVGIPTKKCPELIWASAATVHQLALAMRSSSRSMLESWAQNSSQGGEVFPPKALQKQLGLFWLPVLTFSSARSLHLQLVNRQGAGNNFLKYSCYFYHNFHILLISAVVASEAATTCAAVP